MLTIKIPLQKAQEVKKDLLERELFAYGYAITKEGDYLHFPVTEQFDSPYEFVELDLGIKKENPPTLKEALQSKLSADILERIKTAYDQVGEIAILEIDDEFKQYDTLIGETLLANNPRVTTVLAKDTGHEGVFRTQQMRLLAGIDTRITYHRENNVLLEVDVEEVYYSTRMSTERKRVMEQVKPGEKVLCMFAGCGPYTCVISKNTQAASVVGVEINPVGHELAQHNIAKNKLKNATTYCGDVREVVPDIVAKEGTFDRITMPLPKLAETFLDVAIMAASENAIIHFYAFLHEDEFATAHQWITEASAVAGKKCEILATTKCGQQAPHVYRICVDFKITM